MRYEVTYSLAADANQRSDRSFVSRTDINNLRMVVDANGPNQARQIVESMFGGPNRCRASNAWPI